MFCPNCGKECPDSALFCGNCGAAFNKAPAEPQSPVEPTFTENPVTPDVSPEAPVIEYPTPSADLAGETTVLEFPPPAITPEPPAAPVVAEPTAPTKPEAQDSSAKAPNGLSGYGYAVETPAQFQKQAAPTPPQPQFQQQSVPTQMPPFQQQAIPTQMPNQFNGQNNMNGFYGNNYYANPVPTKKKRSKKPLVFLAIIAILVAVTVFVFPLLKNRFRSTFYSNEKYMQSVIDDDVDTLSKTVTNNYGKFTDLEKKNGSGTFSLKLNEKSSSLLSGILPVSIPNLESVSFDFDNAVKGDSAYLFSKAKINGEGIAEFGIVVDSGKVYLKTDLLSDSYYSLPLDDAEDASAYLSFNKYLDILPKESTVNKLIKKYSKLATSNLHDVEKNKETVEFGGVEMDATVLTAKIDGQYAYDTVKDILEEAKDDKDIKTIIRDISGSALVGEDGEQAVSEYEEGIAELLGELNDENLDTIDSQGASLTVAVDSKGNVLCRTIKMSNAEFSFYSLIDGKNIAYGFNVVSDGQNISLISTGKKSGNKSTGEITFNYSGVSVKLAEFKDYDSHDCENGNISGTVTLYTSQLPADMLKSFFGKKAEFLKNRDLTCSFDSSKSKDSFSLDISEGGESILQINFDHKDGKTSVPSVKNPKSIEDITSEEQQNAMAKLQRITEILKLN